LLSACSIVTAVWFRASRAVSCAYFAALGVPDLHAQALDGPLDLFMLFTAMTAIFENPELRTPFITKIPVFIALVTILDDL